MFKTCLDGVNDLWIPFRSPGVPFLECGYPDSQVPHGFLKFVLYQKFTAENAGFAEFFKFFSAFFALSAVKALFVSTLRKPWQVPKYVL